MPLLSGPIGEEASVSKKKYVTEIYQNLIKSISSYLYSAKSKYRTLKTIDFGQIHIQRALYHHFCFPSIDGLHQIPQKAD